MAVIKINIAVVPKTKNIERLGFGSKLLLTQPVGALLKQVQVQLFGFPNLSLSSSE